MPITTVAVTCTAARPDGSLIAGGKFRFLLSNTDTENGLVVPREISATANASGVAVANLWPNSLGALGTQYRVLLTDPLGSTIDLGSCTVPTSACNLHAILGLGTAPTLDQATVAKLAAQTAAAASSTSATQSASSATQAAASATAAAGSATAAAASQTAATGSVTSAATSATAAGNSATSAASSNTAAGASAISAALSAADALSSKNAAATSATNSASSATSAQTGATGAATSATTATTKASEAATSATNAATSEAAALASKNAAATSETNAQGSATTAATQAGNAATSATNAASNATNAASSASSAASSAAAVAAATTGTMSSQNANSVAITGGAISGTSITVTDNVFTLQDNVDPTKQAQFQLSGLSTGTTFTYTLPAITGSLATLGGLSQTFTGFTTFGATTNTFGSNAGNSTTNLSSGGTLSGNTKTVNVGTGGLSGSTTNITVGSANGSTTTMLGSTTIGGVAGNQSLQVNNVASAVNYLQAIGSVINQPPTLSVQGTDSNISLPLISKGTGAIDLAAGSSGVNISNGGTVTAITRTAVGSGYTTNPTVVISAPTTAGGVQATVSTNYNLFGVGVVSGGTGYTVNDVLTIVGGTFTDQLQLTVTAVSAGVITTVSVLTGSFGIYSALPPSTPATITGGTGIGATFNLTWSLRAITVATAGSGYIEQPTVTFSGGGGTGAAAYAIIGSGTAIKSLGSTMSLSASAGEVLRLSDNGGTATNYLVALSGIASVQPQLRAAGETNTNLLLGSNGTGAVRFTTLGGSAVEQMRVSHTASAVNYLNLTGAATGAAPTLSAQGSDANIGLNLLAKNSGSIALYNGFGIAARFYGGVNNFAISGVGSGNSPEISAQGSDANINLKLTPKGAGTVQYGTYTAGVVAQAGYITITDAGGTLRRLLVG